MQRNTRSQNPGLEAGIEGSTKKKKVVKVSEVIEEVKSIIESWVNVESNRNTLIEEVEVEPRREKDIGPFKSSGGKDTEIESEREEIPIEVEEEIEAEPPATMDPNRGGGGPPPVPPIPPIDPLVRPRGLPMLVPQNLVAMDMPSNLPKFYGTRDDNPSRHMERYVERLIFSLITEQGYWLIWFPTTLDGEAYEWY